VPLKFLPDAIASDVVRKQEIENAVAEGFWTLRPTIQSTVDPRLESVVVSDDIAITYYFWAERMIYPRSIPNHTPLTMVPG
jgi:hypothetical protein